MQTKKKRGAQNEAGSILLFSVLMLGIMLGITLTLASIFIPKIRTISETANSIKALYAADSGLEWCVYKNRFPSSVESQPTMANGSTFALYSDGSPADCTIQPLNYRSVGTYGGVSRSLEASEL